MSISDLERQLPDPELRELLSWWRTARGHRPFPNRAQFDPMEHRPLLPWIFIAEILRDPLDFRYRLSGSALDKNFGGTLTGVRLSRTPIPVEERESIKRQYQDTIDNVRPTFSTHEFEVGRRREVKYHRLVVPLSSNGGTLDLLLGAIMFQKSWSLTQDGNSGDRRFSRRS